MHPYTLLSLVVVVTVVGAGLFDGGKKKDEHKNGILKNLPNLEKFKAKLEKWRQAKTSDFIAKKSKIRKPFGRQHKSKRSSVGDKPITLKELNEELLDVLYEGDIALSEDQVDNLLKQIDEVQRGKRQAIVGNGVKWTMPINYYFTSSISDASTQQLIREALKFWQEHTCVSFAENAAATPRVAFIKDNGCYSYVGRIASWTEQNISIGDGCEHFGIITHEVNHMLGVYHQQSRYDRDNFVYIDVSNVVAGFEHNYDKYTSTDTDNYQVPYDYGSVMHYAEEDFAADTTKPVMIAFDPLYQNTMGQRTGPSFNDILLVNQHYGCLNQCPTSLVCQNGGFQNPANCTNCICPGGFWGSLCEQRDPGSNPGICGSTVQATCDWQTLNGSAGSNVALLNTFPSSCWWHIQAPQGQQIEIQFQNAGGFCSSGCFYGAVEAKMGKFENVGYRFCCPDDLPTSNLFTDSNLAIIGASSRYLTQSFTLTYRIKNGCVTEETTTFKTTTAILSETTKASTLTTSTTTTSVPTTTHAATPSTVPTTTSVSTTTVTPSTTTTAPTTTAAKTTAPTTTTTTPSTTTKKHGCKKCCRCQSSESSESSEECDHHRRHRHHRHHSCGCEEEETTTTAPTTTTQASTTTTTAFTCDKASLDLVFVVDASGSIGIDNFNKTLDALIATVANITIGPNDDQSHIGMVTFADVAPPQAPYKVFGLGDHLDVASVQAAISQTYYTDGGTNIESGMTKALTDVFGNPGDRATVPDIMIVITDGQDSSNVTGAQQVAASRGITIFSVGVGAYVDYNQLVAIAGSTNRAYNATNFDFLDEILADICGNLGGSNSTNSVIAPRLPFSSAIAPKTCVFDVKSGFTKQEFCTARPYCHQIC